LISLYIIITLINYGFGFGTYGFFVIIIQTYHLVTLGLDMDSSAHSQIYCQNCVTVD